MTSQAATAVAELQQPDAICPENQSPQRSALPRKELRAHDPDRDQSREQRKPGAQRGIEWRARDARHRTRSRDGESADHGAIRLKREDERPRYV